MAVQPWHWFVLGIILIIAEIYTATFAILWFGMAALIVSFMLWLTPDLMPTWQIQLLVWVIMSIFSAIFWFKFAQPMRSRRQTKNAVDNGLLIGETGLMIKPPACAESGTMHPGTVRFNVPKVGADEWPCFDADSRDSKKSLLKMGHKVSVVDVVDNVLIVRFVEDT